jgi:hypothetical protein
MDENDKTTGLEKQRYIYRICRTNTSIQESHKERTDDQRNLEAGKICDIIRKLLICKTTNKTEVIKRIE